MGCLIPPGISRFGGNNCLLPTLLKHERYGWGELQISSTRHKWIPWSTSHVAGNSRLALADECNSYKLKPIILQLPLTDYGDLLKMWQYAASLSHSPQMTAHVVNTQVLSVVCCTCTNHISTLKMTASAAGIPHTYIPSSNAPHLRLSLLNDRWHYANI